MNKNLICKEIKEIIRNIPDFPKAGIIFRDVTPLLGNAQLFSASLDLMTEKFNSEK